MKQKMEENPRSHYYAKTYETTLLRLQTQVLTELKTLNKLVNSQEGNTDYTDNTEYNEMVREKKIAIKLLESWKITVHL